jgi:hypothetical protein
MAPVRRARASVLTFVLAAPLAGTACFSSPDDPAVISTLVVTPTDGVTGLTVLEVDMGESPGPTDGTLLTLLETSAKLATWPDDTPVANVVSAIAGPTGNGGLAFKPLTAVVDGWYEVILPALPGSVYLVAQNFFQRPDGRSSVRVHVGSAPEPWHLDACAPSPTVTSLALFFSEIVHAATTSTMPLDISAGPASALVTCTTETPPLVDRPAQEYDYTCPSLGAGDVVVITITDGFLSASGVSVPVGKRSVSFGAWPADEIMMAGCSVLELER